MDFGERRVGLALSDPTGVLASPLETLRRRRGKKPPLRALEELARAKIFDARCWVMPVLANGRIYGRTNLGEVVCLDVRGE